MVEPERRLVGYIRVSTEDQDLTLQRDALIKYGVNPLYIYEEKRSGKSMKRPVLDLALKGMREHDTLVVWKLDRFGRDALGILAAMKKLDERGIHFVSITEGFDAATPMGKFMIQMMAGLAEMERNMTAERTKAGIAAKKASGQTWGRAALIRDNPKRMAWLRRQDKAGKLRVEDKHGDMHCIWDGGHGALWAELLDKDQSKKQNIKNIETVRRWFRDGCPGLDPLPETDEQ